MDAENLATRCMPSEDYNSLGTLSGMKPSSMKSRNQGLRFIIKGYIYIYIYV